MKNTIKHICLLAIVLIGSYSSIAQRKTMITQKQTEQNVKNVQEGFAAYFTGDPSKMRALLADNVELIVPGNSSLAGTYKGPEGVLGFGGKIFQISGNTFTSTPKYFAGNGNFVNILMEDAATINGVKFEWTEGIVQEFDANGKIIKVRPFFSDQAAWDKFFDKK
jgi:ketosteroid isomerase-like protein